jgi:uncharacterized protein (TIRG00374 family)
MRNGRAIGSFALLSVLYFSVLLWMDSRSHLLDEIHKLAAILPILFLLSLVTYVVRYGRWHWLLRNADLKLNPVIGFLAYLTGFAFTATPGKVGELVRMRYLTPLGASPALVLGAFIFERSFDLISVLLLSAVAISDLKIFLFVLTFVSSLLAALYYLAYRPKILIRASAWLVGINFIRTARLVATLKDGLSFAVQWMCIRDMAVALGLGLLAWGITSATFLVMLGYLGIELDFLKGFAIYPLAMLAGAASMIPGGLGSTEASITALLVLHGVTISLGALAAVGIRLATIWFAILIGFLSMFLLETSVVKKFAKI